MSRILAIFALLLVASSAFVAPGRNAGTSFCLLSGLALLLIDGHQSH
jgi:hypothetical protein